MHLLCALLKKRGSFGGKRSCGIFSRPCPRASGLRMRDGTRGFPVVRGRDFSAGSVVTRELAEPVIKFPAKTLEHPYYFSKFLKDADASVWCEGNGRGQENMELNAGESRTAPFLSCVCAVKFY